MLKLTSWLVVVLAVLFMTPAVFGQCPSSPPSSTTACMDLISGGNVSGTSYVMDGVYVGPYTATINSGPATDVICDDFYDESYVPELWTANVYAGSNPSNFSSTQMASETGLTGSSLTTAYDEVGYLAVQLLDATNAATPNATMIGEIDFALWSVFEPSALTYGSSPIAGGPDATAVQGYLTAAANFANQYGGADISQFTIYSPDGAPIVPAGAGPPQEFLVYTGDSVPTPEPASVALLALDFSGVAGLIFFLRRKRKPSQG